MKTLTEKPLIYSYRDHRTVVGILGMALPFVLFLGALIVFQTGMQDSISSYYHTGMRNVFVGALWAIGLCLLSYKGYERIDDMAGNFACVSAMGITLFPTAPQVNPSIEASWIGGVHLFFGALFFLTLIYFSLCLFTKTHPEKTPTLGKLLRNKIYRGCGYSMALCMLLILIYFVLPNKEGSFLERINPVFLLETIAILAFGLSWLAKGDDIQVRLNLQ